MPPETGADLHDTSRNSQFHCIMQPSKMYR
nr:MAG TPA: hypothetical protein [Caudoviricetes sp.]